jgi:hypothetical protein
VPAEWKKMVDASVLRSLPESEINRQSIIYNVINKESKYVQDLDIVQSVRCRPPAVSHVLMHRQLFITPLRQANPPVIARDALEGFVDDVFANILDLRECNRRLLEALKVRQREQNPVIQRVGDVFLGAATEFRLAYPHYVGHLPLAEKRMKDELESNPEFRVFLDVRRPRAMPS